MKLSVSTSWISGKTNDARRIVASLQRLGVANVELEYRLTREVFARLKPLLKEAGIMVTSLHNYCPFPALKPQAGPSGDYFKLSSPDREERRLAVEWTLKTIEHAHDLEAECVVLHCGQVEMSPQTDRVYAKFKAQEENSEAFKEIMNEEMQRRERCKQPFVDALLFSLDQLAPLAERYKIRLGLENRYHYHELPGFEDMAVILDEFMGGPVGYWHDSGHAHAFEMLGIVAQNRWLERYQAHLVGLHLHDAQKLSDHRVPGTGDIDFDLFSPFIERDLPVVLELAPACEEQDVRQALDFFRR